MPRPTRSLSAYSKLGGKTLHSVGDVKRLQRILDNDADYVTSGDMLAELRDDNRQLAKAMRETHSVCDEHADVATASLLEVWIDEAERRTWFLFEAGRAGWVRDPSLMCGGATVHRRCGDSAVGSLRLRKLAVGCIGDFCGREVWRVTTLTT